MPDSTAINEILKQVADAYKVFSLELEAVQLKKADLIRSIIERVDREKTGDIKNLIQQMIYEQSSRKQA